MWIPLRRVVTCRRRKFICMPKYRFKPRLGLTSGSCRRPCGRYSSGCAPCCSASCGICPEQCCGPWCESCLDPAWYSWMAPKTDKACCCAKRKRC